MALMAACRQWSESAPLGIPVKPGEGGWHVSQSDWSFLRVQELGQKTQRMRDPWLDT